MFRKAFLSPGLLACGHTICKATDVCFLLRTNDLRKDMDPPVLLLVIGKF